jgi:hypothetical protein
MLAVGLVKQAGGLIGSHHPQASRQQYRPVLAGPARSVQHLATHPDSPRQSPHEIGMGRRDGTPVLVVMRAVQGIESLHAQRAPLSQEGDTVGRRHVHRHSIHVRRVQINSGPETPRKRAVCLYRFKMSYGV